MGSPIRNLALVLLIAFVTVSGSPSCGAPLPPEEYTFVVDTERTVGIDRGPFFLIGKLDAEGSFICEKKFPIGQQFTSPPKYELISFPRREEWVVYEYRSGRLIKGFINLEG